MLCMQSNFVKHAANNKFAKLYDLVTHLWERFVKCEPQCIAQAVV